MTNNNDILMTKNSELEDQIKELQNIIQTKVNESESKCNDVEKYLDMIKQLREEKQQLINDNENIINEFNELQSHYQDLLHENESEKEKNKEKEKENNNDEDLMEIINSLKGQINEYEVYFNEVTKKIPKSNIDIDEYKIILDENDYLKAELNLLKKQKRDLISFIRSSINKLHNEDDVNVYIY